MLFDELDEPTVITNTTVLVACEESQTVTTEFRKLGIEAYSCDLEPCSGGYPEWHIQTDVSVLLKLNWELIIAFPPCTHLTTSGARWFPKKIKDGSQSNAIKFFSQFITANCKRLCIENPVGIMSNIYRKPDQIIQPWMFGHDESKPTCLWLRNLPLLKPTDIVESHGSRILEHSPSDNRQKLRSKTYLGIARAMANQWGHLI